MLLVSSGFFSLVFGFSNAETGGWGAPLTLSALAASVVALVAFVALEARAANPLLPLCVVRDRARGGAYAAVAIIGAAMFSVYLFLTFYMQRELGFSPVATGLGFLPMVTMIVTTTTIVQNWVLHRIQAKPVVVAGMSFGVIAMLLFTRLSAHGSYAGQVLPGLLLAGLAAGCIFAPAFSTGTLGVGAKDAGIAAAMVNTSMQIGGSVGIALLSTIFASATATFARAHPGPAAAVVHGYTTGFAWAAALFAAGLLITALVLPARREPSNLERNLSRP